MESVSAQGDEIPKIGLGTFRLEDEACVKTVQAALEMGYRHIDTAEYYDNQRAIGDAIDTMGVPREELFLTTKVWKTNLEREAVHSSARESLERLGVEYVDLLLIHWPNENVPVEETLGAMNRLQEKNRVRYIGVSNFSVSQLQEAMVASETPIVTNQVKYHPYVDRDELLEYCREHEVLLTAYSPLAEGRVVDDGTLAKIGGRYDKSPPQVALRWLVQQDGVIAIPKASSREHLRANLEVFDFELTTEEMVEVTSLRGGLIYRVRKALGG